MRCAIEEDSDDWHCSEEENVTRVVNFAIYYSCKQQIFMQSVDKVFFRQNTDQFSVKFGMGTLW
jgi:hypothetical protein